MHWRLLTFAILFFTLAKCQQGADPGVIISDIKKLYVPDISVGVFSITPVINSSVVWLKGETDNEPARSALVKRLTDAGFKVRDSIRLLPDKTDKPWGLINISVANLRQRPSHDAELVTQALMGTPVKILKADDDWVYIQTPDRYISWCEMDILTTLSSQELLTWQNSKRFIVSEWFDLLRDSLSDKVICDISAGNILQFSSENSNHVFLKTPDGRKGRVLKTQVEEFSKWKQSTVLNKEKVLATAGKFMGTPYLWGGLSIKGVDCSGFTKMVYFLNGCILPRDASQQAEYGNEIPISANFDYNSGDLLFFGRRAKGDKPGKITHVGLYLGNSEFIHSSGMVKVNSFDSTRSNFSRYRTIGLLKVRRLIGNLDSHGIISVKNHPWY